MSAHDDLRAALLSAARDAVGELQLSGENLPFYRVPGAPWAAVHLRMGPTYAVTLGDGGTDGLSGFMQVDLSYPPNCGDALEKKALVVLSRLHVGRRLVRNATLVDLMAHGKAKNLDVPTALRRSLTVYWTGRLPR